MYYIFICKFKYAGVCVIAIHYISKKIYFSLVTKYLIYFYLLISNTNSDGEERHIVQL